MSRPPSKRPPVFNRPGLTPGAAVGYDLAANVLVGLGLGWVFQRFFPGADPWGLAGGLVLGAASGFFQLFKTQQAAAARSAKGHDKDHAEP